MEGGVIVPQSCACASVVSVTSAKLQIYLSGFLSKVACCTDLWGFRWFWGTLLLSPPHTSHNLHQGRECYPQFNKQLTHNVHISKDSDVTMCKMRARAHAHTHALCRLLLLVESFTCLHFRIVYLLTFYSKTGVKENCYVSRQTDGLEFCQRGFVVTLNNAGRGVRYIPGPCEVH